MGYSAQSPGFKTLADQNLVDLFGRVRVSNPHTIFSSKLLEGKDPIFFDEKLIGSGTSTRVAGDGAVEMSVTANGQGVIRQTFMRMDYQSAKSQRVLLTGVLGAPVANTVSRIGYFNSNIVTPFDLNYDGLYWEADGSSVGVCVAKGSGTAAGVTRVAQSSWNIDKMDGTGRSGITVDWDKTQIMVIEFQFLGVGSVLFSLSINGDIYPVHFFHHANGAQTYAYMSHSNHSVRYEVRSTGGTKTIKQICCSVQSEGGVEASGVSGAVTTPPLTGVLDIDRMAASNFGKSVVSLRLKDTSYGTTVKIDGIDLYLTSSPVTFHGWLVRNPTLTGGAGSVTWPIFFKKASFSACHLARSCSLMVNSNL
jgi:hypothetical protein